MRILLTGWRHATLDDHGKVIADAMALAVSTVVAMRSKAAVRVSPTLVQGECSGVDEIAALIAQRCGWSVEGHPAIGHPTEDFGGWPAAGPRRNRHMVKLGADLCLGLPGPGSKGTWGCLQEAATAGIASLVIPLTAVSPPE